MNMEKEEVVNLENLKIPKCLGVIIDGNRRWAKEKGMQGFEGHKEGLKRLKELVNWSLEVGVKYLVVYTFSTENWKRSIEEKEHLFGLIRKMFEKDISEFSKKGVRVMPVGQINRFPEDIKESMEKMIEETKNNKEMVFAPALSYGGRAEIIEAVNKFCEQNKKNPSNGAGEEITEESFEKFLWTQGVPDIDLIIRTGGEKRLSNFMTWKSVYSELYFSDSYWPDFSKEELYSIFEEFKNRERRMGK